MIEKDTVDFVPNFGGSLPEPTVLPAIALIALVAYSRIYLQVHYPTDVLAGMALAAVVVALAARLLLSTRRDDAQ